MSFFLPSRRAGFTVPVVALSFVIGTLVCPCVRVAHAQTTYTYKGTTGTTAAPSDGTFFTGFNGYSGGLPQTNGSYGATNATFVFGGTSTYTATDDLNSSLYLNVLQFTNTNTVNSAEKVTLARGGSGTSNQLFFTDSSNGAKILLNNSGAVQVNLDMVIGASTTVSGSGSATFTGALTGNQSFTYAGSSGAALTLTGVSNITAQTYFNGGTTQIITTAGSTTAASLSLGGSSNAAYIGNTSNDNGTVLVSGVSTNGTASTLNAYFLNVGNQGKGTLNVTNGALETSSFGVYIGSNAGSTGTVTVSGVNTSSGSALASTLNIGVLYVGLSGTATLSVLDGAKVTSTTSNSAIIGGSSSGTGTVTVSGVNTASGTPLSSTFNVGFLNIGASGTGTLNILDGATASAASIRIGSSVGSKGIMTVSGVNATGIASSLNLGTQILNPLTVGDAGVGTLNILDGATVNNPNNNYIEIGARSGGTGTVTVSGINNGSSSTLVSTLNSGRFLYVGNSGSGTLNVTNGGKVNVDYTVLASANGSSSTVIVNGGSLITNAISSGSGTVASFKLANPTGGGYALSIGGNGSSSNTTSLISANISDAITGDGASGNIAGGPGGAGGINKTGPGTLTLTGANTFSGGVNIAGGTVVARSTGLGTGRTLLSSAGTLSVGTAVNTKNTSQSVNTLTARSLALTANGSSSQPQMTFNLGQSGVSDRLILTETDPSVFSSSGTFFVGFASATGMSLDAGQYTLITFTGQSTTTNLPDINLFKATRTGNLATLDTPANPFQYIINSMGQQTLTFNIGGASVTPEPNSLLLLLCAGGPGIIIAYRFRLPLRSRFARLVSA